MTQPSLNIPASIGMAIANELMRLGITKLDYIHPALHPTADNMEAKFWYDQAKVMGVKQLVRSLIKLTYLSGFIDHPLYHELMMLQCAEPVTPDEMVDRMYRVFENATECHFRDIRECTVEFKRGNDCGLYFECEPIWHVADGDCKVPDAGRFIGGHTGSGSKDSDVADGHPRALPRGRFPWE